MSDEVLTTDDKHLIAGFGLFSALLGVTGAASLSALFFVFPGLRNFRGKLILYLSISHVVWITSILIGLCWALADEIIPSGLCVFTGFLLQWFTVSSDFWVISIAVYLYFNIVRGRDLEDKEWVFHAVCWGLPFILSLIPFSTCGYGIAGTWCWVRSPVQGLWFSYLFVWITALVIIVLYALMVRYVRASAGAVSLYLPPKEAEKRDKDNRKLFRKLAFYPIVYIIQWTPSMINRIQNAVHPTDPIVGLYVLQLLFSLSIGLQNFFVYGSFNRKSLRKQKVFSKITKNLKVEEALPTVKQ